MPTADRPLPTIHCGFPGGNILLDGVTGDEVRLRQDLRDTSAYWFYWAFAVRQAAGRTLTFRFPRGPVFEHHGPCVSLPGAAPRWAGKETLLDDTAFRFTFPPGADEVRFAHGFPYVEQDLHRFLAGARQSPNLTVDTLCHSRRGRPVELLRLGRLDGAAPHRVLLAGRHHACEALASFALEGFLQAVLSASADGQWLREQVEFLVVPFTDKDGVEEGDQGKLRRPRDHNRDYVTPSIYAETAALRRLVPAWAGDRLRLALDFHDPYIQDKTLYFVAPPGDAGWAELQRFSHLLAATPSLPLPYDPAANLPFGQRWNNEREGCHELFSAWALGLPGVRFAAVVEIPYSQCGDVVVEPARARDFGAALASNVRHYLESLAPPASR